MEIVAREAAEFRIARQGRVEAGRIGGQIGQRRRREIGGDASDLVRRQLRGGLARLDERVLDRLRDLLGTLLVDQDLDPRLVLVSLGSVPEFVIA